MRLKTERIIHKHSNLVGKFIFQRNIEVASLELLYCVYTRYCNKYAVDNVLWMREGCLLEKKLQMSKAKMKE